MSESHRGYSIAAGDLRNARASDERARTAPSTPNDGIVRVSRETSGRRGETVTVFRGIPARTWPQSRASSSAFAASVGSGKDGVIEIQGDHRAKVVPRLEAQATA